MYISFGRTICSIEDLPQQCDGASCGIMTVKFIEHLSADISLDKVDPSKITYYLLKLAIEALKGEAHGSSGGVALYGDPSSLIQLFASVILCSNVKSFIGSAAMLYMVILGNCTVGGSGYLPYMANNLFPFCRHGR
ncbi:hypothetical protein L3X38_001656 [Prunus dulcis]|uniref:Ubiquitin-like protease family profile domain-containing protein n=1 Tax=Prunus dulcis TaxID=3755 RepID=A0AAD4WTZ1_PRUDU|nr:hypothetical protein L3X38_001656 [Prunus dulcis]